MKGAVICASAFFAASLYSCDKNETNNSQVNEDGIETVKFFEVEKGDSIAKGIFREKPEFNNEEVEVLFTTETIESQLKASGSSEIPIYSNGKVTWSLKYIGGLKTHVSKKTTLLQQCRTVDIRITKFRLI